MQEINVVQPIVGQAIVRRRRPTTCSNCWIVGHNRQTCRLPAVQPAVRVGLYDGLSEGRRQLAIQYRNRILQCRFMTGMTEAEFEHKFQFAIDSRNAREMVRSVSNVLLHHAHGTFDLLMRSTNNIIVSSELINTHSNLVHNIIKYMKCIEKVINLRSPRIAPPVITTKTHIQKLQIVRAVDEQEPGHESTCTICLDTLETSNIIHTNCNHVYCLACVSGYVDSIKTKTCLPTCPMCRGKLDHFNTYSDDVHRELTNAIQAL